ncbi:MAG: PAC2 family protein [Ferrimicrobium sp.]
MENIVWHRRVGKRKKPATLVIALGGWTDAGDAASIAANTLIQASNARALAYLDPEPYYDFSVVRPHIALSAEGVREIRWGTLVFHSARERSPSPLIIGVGPEPQFRWKTCVAELSDLAAFLAVDRVIALGSLLAATPHTRTPKVIGYSSMPAIPGLLDMETIDYEGPTGLLSVLQSTLNEFGVEVTSLWVEVPHYLSQFPARRAARALLDRTELLLDFEPNLTPLTEALAESDREIAQFVARDPDLTTYVNSLEANYERERTERDSLNSMVAEAERFLRHHLDGGQRS